MSTRNTPCDGCPRKPHCTEPCNALKDALAGHTPSVKRQKVYGFYHSMRGLTRRKLRHLGHNLTRRQLEMVEMYYFRDYTMTDIARELGISKGAVSRCLGRARNTLFGAERVQ